MALGSSPTDPSNRVLADPRAAALGQQLFFDPELSGPLGKAQPGQAVYLGTPGTPGRIACVDCHAPTGFFDDTRSTPGNVSFGIDFTNRNSPSVVNVGFYRVFGWDGRSDSLWMQCGVAFESKAAMGGSRVRLARHIAAKYAPAFEDLFGDAGFSRLDRDGGDETEFELADGGKPSPASAQYLNQIAADSYKAMAAYVSRLVSVNAPIDVYASGDFTALSPAEKRGLKLFLGRAGCVECHAGPNFTDNQFHSVGVPQRGEHVPLIDQGRVDGLTQQVGGDQAVFNRCGIFNDTQRSCVISLAGPTDAGLGQFRTKSLRNVARTPPYMHAGQFQTLEEVVRFYNGGGGTTGFVGTKSSMTVPLGLTDAEVVDLVAFFQALSGEPVKPALTCDPSARNLEAGAHRYSPCPDGGR